MFNVHFSLLRDSSEINTGDEVFFLWGGGTFSHSLEGASSFRQFSGGGRFNLISTNYKNIGSVAWGHRE